MIYRHIQDGSLWEATDEGGFEVRACPQGGGMSYVLPRHIFEDTLIPVLGNLPFGPWRKGTTGFDDGPEYPCFLNDHKWNGWAMPCFTKDVALTLAQGEDSLWYDVNRDQIVWKLNGEEEPYRYSGQDIEVDGVTIRVFPVGAGDFCWNNYV
jgi:hypothetical protein